jgi:hypothetical protein
MMSAPARPAGCAYRSSALSPVGSLKHGLAMAAPSPCPQALLHVLLPGKAEAHTFPDWPATDQHVLLLLCVAPAAALVAGCRAPRVPTCLEAAGASLLLPWTTTGAHSTAQHGRVLHSAAGCQTHSTAQHITSRHSTADQFKSRSCPCCQGCGTACGCTTAYHLMTCSVASKCAGVDHSHASLLLPVASIDIPASMLAQLCRRGSLTCLRAAACCIYVHHRVLVYGGSAGTASHILELRTWQLLPAGPLSSQRQHMVGVQLACAQRFRGP